LSSTSAEISNTDPKATLENDVKNEDPEEIIPNSYRPKTLTAKDILKLSERCKAIS
jgi:hypothetical protein